MDEEENGVMVSGVCTFYTLLALDGFQATTACVRAEEFIRNSTTPDPQRAYQSQ